MSHSHQITGGSVVPVKQFFDGTVELIYLVSAFGAAAEIGKRQVFAHQSGVNIGKNGDFGGGNFLKTCPF